MDHRVQVYPTPLFYCPYFFPIGWQPCALVCFSQTILLLGNDLILSGAPETYLDSIFGIMWHFNDQENTL